MKQLVSLVLFVVLSMTITAQDSPVIMTIDGQPVTKHEFESIYKKNNKDADVTKAALDEYVELFINFKLKVREAERLRMDTVGQFVTELKGYRKQLARPYLVDNQMSEELLKEAYDRMTEEVDASHLLINIAPDATPADTLVAYIKIKGIRANIIKGETTFEKAASSLSDDPSSKDNKGRLGYFTSLQMVYPFETAAYETPIGEVSKIVRTQFGYHILTVHDKRPARGEVLVSHIMIKTTVEDTDVVKTKAEKTIKDLYTELEGGADFGKLALQHSADKSSSRNNGELPWFGPGKMVKEFEDVSFGLENSGDYSEPFKTRYGWHIVKRIDHKVLDDFESMRKSLKQRISKDIRSQMSTTSFVSKVKKEYGFKEKRKSLEPVHALADSTILRGAWKPTGTETMKKWLFKIGKTKYTQADFVHYLRMGQGRTPEKSVRKYVDDRYDLFVTSSVLDYEDERLEGKHPAFKSLMKEYRDGILLFELTDEMVWTKAVKDTTGLKNYYEEHGNDFMYGERLQGTVYRTKDVETAAIVKELIAEGTSNIDIEKQVNEETQLDLTIQTDVYEIEDDEVTGLIPAVLGVSDVHIVNDRAVFMDVKEILEPSQKPFNKIKGLVTAAYQTQLEQEWIQELRARYTVELDKDVLYSVK